MSDRIKKPFAWCCNSDPSVCDCVNPNHGFAWVDVPQPTGIEAEVCRDIAARQALGLRKYGVTVADNPLPLREWLRHAYEETLDAAIYLKRAIAETDKEGK